MWFMDRKSPRNLSWRYWNCGTEIKSQCWTEYAIFVFYLWFLSILILIPPIFIIPFHYSFIDCIFHSFMLMENSLYLLSD